MPNLFPQLSSLASSSSILTMKRIIKGRMTLPGFTSAMNRVQLKADGIPYPRPSGQAAKQFGDNNDDSECVMMIAIWLQ